MGKRIVVYTSKNCTPCVELSKILDSGGVSNPVSEISKVELVDIETDEGFERFTKEVLSKDDGAVPSAYLDGKKCAIQLLDDDTIYFDCTGQPSSPPEKSSPPATGEQHNAVQPDPEAPPQTS